MPRPDQRWIMFDKQRNEQAGYVQTVRVCIGVALMGQARGVYTFFSHLKWTWAIALGYFASIYVHYLLNSTM